MEEFFKDADELCSWCIDNNYKVTHFNELLSKSGEVIDNETYDVKGYWVRIKTGFKILIYDNDTIDI